MKPARELLAEGRSAAPALGRTAFCAAHGARSEAEYKRRRRDEGRLTYHAHLGLSDWAATSTALDELVEGLGEHTLDRFGLCLSRSMSVPAERRAATAKETGPRLERRRLARCRRCAGPGAPRRFHDRHASGPGEHRPRARGGHHHDRQPRPAFRLRTARRPRRRRPHGDDGEGARGDGRPARGALVHSYLDDGPAMQFSHYGGYLGWAALELYAVEGLIGARLAHCYGGLVPEPTHRAIVGLALDDLRDGDSLGSMIYGNTVEYGADRHRNLAVLTSSVMVDVATQLHRPTGHAINPVPLSEAERIPDAAEILEVQLIARELEREVRRGAALLDWAWAERRAAEAAAHARAFRDGVLATCATGASTSPTPPSCCWRCGARPRRSSNGACASPPRASCGRWRPGSTASSRASPNARGARSRGSTACASCWPRSRSTTWSATRSPASCRRPVPGDRAAELGLARAGRAGRRRRGRATRSSSRPTTAARSRSGPS